MGSIQSHERCLIELEIICDRLLRYVKHVKHDKRGRDSR